MTVKALMSVRHLNLVAPLPHEGTLRSRGLVDYPGGGTLQLTEAGFAAVGPLDTKPTRDDLVRRIVSVLKGEPSRRLFMALVEAAEPLTREDLAQRCGYTVNGHFNNLCGELKTLGVAEYPRKGFVGVSPIVHALP